MSGYKQLREEMIQTQLIPRGIADARLLAAIRRIPRHQFVPEDLQRLAYVDHPLDIGRDQTISQPYIVAFMSEQLKLKGYERVLEIGTGSGYQTAILAELASYIFSLERFPRLAENAGNILTELGYQNIDIHLGDGSQGLADMSPFDAIIVTAAAPSLPGPLCSQLSPDGGRMIIPVGNRKAQELQLVMRRGDRWHVRHLMSVRFVPLVGRYGFKADPSASV